MEKIQTETGRQNRGKKGRKEKGGTSDSQVWLPKRREGCESVETPQLKERREKGGKGGEREGKGGSKSPAEELRGFCLWMPSSARSFILLNAEIGGWMFSA